MSLYRYLINIRQGKSINAHHLKELLKSQGCQINQIGELVHVKGDNYKINIVNQELLEKLVLATEPSASRTDAAIRLNDTHKHGTNSAYFVYKTLKQPVYHGAFFCGPTTSLIHDWPDSPETDVVLIENSECFTFSDAFLKAIGLNILSQKTIIVWSCGKGITHKQAIRLLSVFKRIYYCPDYDLAGLEIFETLARDLGDKIEFCMPANLPSYAPYCRKPDQAQFTRALAKANSLGFFEMVALLENGRGVLEQEALLGNMISE